MVRISNNGPGWKKKKKKRKQSINFVNIEEQKTQNNIMQISDHSYRILIVEGSGSGKTNSLFNLITHHVDITKNYLYAKGPCEAKYNFK